MQDNAESKSMFEKMLEEALNGADPMKSQGIVGVVNSPVRKPTQIIRKDEVQMMDEDPMVDEEPMNANGGTNLVFHPEDSSPIQPVSEQVQTPNTSPAAKKTTEIDDDGGLQSKNWKHRKEAVLRMNSLDNSTPFILVPCLRSEKNALCIQEMIMKLDDCCSQGNCDPSCIKAIINKGLSSNRSMVRDLSVSLLVKIAELGNAGDVSRSLLHTISDSKIARVQTLSLETLAKVLNCPNFPFQDVLTVAVQNFEAGDKAVRKASFNLCVQIYNGLENKSQIEPYLMNVKVSKLKELRKAFEKSHGGQPVVAMEIDSNEEPSAVEIEKPPTILQPYTLPEYDALSQIPDNFYQNINEAKWQVRKEALVDLLKVLDNAPLRTGNFDPLVRILLKVIAEDKIVLVVKLAIEAIGLLGIGLKTQFHPQACVHALLLKFREKRVDASTINATLDILHKHCQPVTNFSNAIVEGCATNIPFAKASVLQWVERSLADLTGNLGHFIDPLSKCCLEEITDANQSVRDSACKVMARLVWRAGHHMDSYLMKLDKLHHDKVQEIASSFPTIETKEDIHFPEGETQSKRVGRKKSTSKKKIKTQTKVSGTKQGLSSTRRPSSSKPRRKKSVKSVQPNVSVEEAIQTSSSFIPHEIIEKIGSKAWKERKEGALALYELINEQESMSEVVVESITTHLVQITNFTDSNFQVQLAWFENIKLLTNKAVNFSKYSASQLIPSLLDKLNTTKVKEGASESLTLLCECVNPQFVSNQSYNLLQNHKNPRIFAAGLNWIDSIIVEFGLHHFKCKELIDFLKLALSHANPLVKQAAINAFCTIKKFVGDDILSYLQSVKPSLLDNIIKELALVQKQEMISTRNVRGQLEGDMQAKSGNNEGDTMLPRVDVSRAITTTLKNELSDSNWKSRITALEKVQMIIEDANKRIQPTVAPLFRTLRKLLDDNAIKVVIMTLDIIKLLGEALGTACEKYCKIIISNVIAKISNNNKFVRAKSLETIEMWASLITVVPLCKYFIKLLKGKGSQGKAEILRMVAEKPGHLFEKKDLLLDLSVPLATLVSHKKQDIRHLSEGFILKIVDTMGRDFLEKALRNCNDQTTRAVKKLLNSQNAMVDETASISSTRRRPSTHSSHSVEHGSNTDLSAMQDNDPIFLRNNQKSHREKRHGGNPQWLVSKIDEEHYQLLSHQLTLCVSPALHSMFTSNDFQMNIEAITLTTENVNAYASEIFDSIDVLYQWCSLKMLENTSLLKSILKFVDKSLSLFQKPMTDYEANSILPSLVENVGHSIKPIREYLSRLILSFERVYPPKKIAHLLLTGTKSSKYKTRVDSIGMLTTLVEKHGLDIISLRSLPRLTKLIGDTDSVRSPTLRFIEMIYQLIGNDLWTYLINIDPTHKKVIELKLRAQAPQGTPQKKATPRKATRMTPRTTPQSKSRPTSSATKRSKDEDQMDLSEDYVQDSLPSRSLWESEENSHSRIPVMKIDTKRPQTQDKMVDEECNEISKNSGKRLSASLVPPIQPPPIEVNRVPENISHNVSTPTPTLPERMSFPTRPTLSETLKMIKVSEYDPKSNETTKEALKTMSYYFQEDPRSFVPILTPVVNTLLDNLELSFYGYKRKSISGEFFELLILSLDELFRLRDVVEFVSKDVLQDAIRRILEMLNTPNLDSKLLERLNQLTIRILGGANRTFTFTALFNLLSFYYGQKDGNNIIELVIQCLKKLISRIPSNHDRVDFEILLMDVHNFLDGKNLKEQDKAISACKTLLDKIIDAKGKDTLKCLSLIPSHKSEVIYGYISAQLIQRGLIDAPSSLPSNSQKRIPNQAETLEFNQILKAIHEKDSLGFTRLYQYVDNHPDVDINHALMKCSPAFQSFIKRKIAEKGNINSPQTPTPTSEAKSAASFLNRLELLHQRFHNFTKAIPSQEPAKPTNNNNRNSVPNVPALLQIPSINLPVRSRSFSEKRDSFKRRSYDQKVEAYKKQLCEDMPEISNKENNFARNTL